MDEMNDDDFFQLLRDAYNEMDESDELHIEDFELNIEQYNRLLDAADYFAELCEKYEEDELLPIMLDPRHKGGGVEIKIGSLILTFDKMNRFKAIIQSADSIIIEPTLDDRVSISIGFTDVYKEKP